MCRPLRRNIQDDLLSLQPSQVEKQNLGLDSQPEDDRSNSQSEYVENNTDSRLIKYKSAEVTEDSQNKLSEIFGEDAHTG